MDPQTKRALLDFLYALIAAAIMLGGVMLLASCATWTHPSKGPAAFDQDRYDCEREAAPMTDRLAALQMQTRCLRLKGWTPQ